MLLLELGREYAQGSEIIFDRLERGEHGLTVVRGRLVVECPRLRGGRARAPPSKSVCASSGPNDQKRFGQSNNLLMDVDS